MTDVDKAYRKIIYLSFPQEKSGRPMVCNLTRLFDLTFNILKAQITPRREGNMTLELSGTEENYRKGVSYLKDNGIKVANAAQRISRDEESCTNCGTCTAICPSDSLHMDRTTMRVTFDKDLCSACGLCTRVCPVRAMHVEVENGTDW